MENEILTNVLWIDFMANSENLLDKFYRTKYMENAKKARFTHVVIDAKTPYGFVTYPSSIAPHISEWERFSNWKDKDYVRLMSESASQFNLKVLIKCDIFSEGSIVFKNRKCHLNTNWQIQYYHFEKGKPVYTKAENYTEQGIFVNPALLDVQQYELSIMQEILTNYQGEGFILDRCRYPNVYADFSLTSCEIFEKASQIKVKNWPADILTPLASGFEPGPLFQEWLTWRASVTKGFILKAKNLVKGFNPLMFFGLYVGSWYPDYFHEGVNWGSKEYRADLEWVNKDYYQTGIADELDFLMVGCYYADLIKAEAENKGLEEWKSVEGAIEMSKQATANKVTLLPSLFVFDYEGNYSRFKEAIELCQGKSDRFMIFDSIYLEKYNWW
ncbi:alpha amylase family protein [Alkalihalobacillus sp. 1P02AB]|uniref:alpha amylase family protein n=1 Tax=Alkalihalobacillus sp. 1P02AB TaxID=3132260 RepID=UPI0039A56F30